MKKLIYLLGVVFVLSGFSLNAQPSADTLTNEKVIQLSKIGLQPSVIISKIQSSINLFDVSTDGLISLSSSGVSAEVINEMMKADAKAQVDIAYQQRDMSDPKTMRPPGIYLYDPTDESKPLKRVDPNVISSTKVSSSGVAISGPLVRTSPTEKLKSTIAGADSRLKIMQASPVFYFYFENTNNSNSDNWFFATASSPNEFALVKLTEKSKNREMIIASSGAYVESSGIPDKDKVQFDYVEEAEGVYKVFFNKPLKDGEYCFLYASTVPNRFSNNKVFDFGIHAKN